MQTHFSCFVLEYFSNLFFTFNLKTNQQKNGVVKTECFCPLYAEALKPSVAVFEDQSL